MTLAANDNVNTYASQLAMRYTRIRKKLWAEPPMRAPEPQPPRPAAVIEPAPEPDVPEPRPLLQILMAVASAHDLTLIELISQSRSRKLTNAREEYYYRAAVETPCSLPQIGARCGGRDHTTVLAGVRRYCLKNSVPLPRGWKPGTRMTNADEYAAWVAAVALREGGP